MMTYLYIPGGSAWDGERWHILSYPMSYMCNGVDGFAGRRVDMVAPLEMWCKRCLLKAGQKNSPQYVGLHYLPDPVDGFIVVAGSSLFASRITDQIVGQSAPHSAKLDAQRDFHNALEAEGRRYGFQLVWLPDYSPIPVITSDRLDTCFNWHALIGLAIEHIVNRPAPADKKRITT